ncbi:hypothetical protein SODG_006349 [Sodalis praecaptivus]
MADAGRFAREHADGHPLVIVGIRSGGSIVAPRWVAGVAKTTQSTPPWLTVRPLRQQDTSCRYHPAELATLLITDPSGNPLMHLRFIGENAYGLAEFGRLKQACAASAQAAFMDGYHITQHLHGLRPLRALLAHANGPERRRWRGSPGSVRAYP